MPVPATIRNAYLAQGMALAALTAFALLYTFADAHMGSAFIFQAPALAAAFVGCLWSLRFSIRAALTVPWRVIIPIWILVALELNVPAFYTWFLLGKPTLNELGVWSASFCSLGLPVFVPCVTIAGVAIAVVLRFRAKLRYPLAIAAILLAPLALYICPTALYLMCLTASNRVDGPGVAWHGIVIEYTPGFYKTSLDRFLVWTPGEPFSEWHSEACRKGFLPNSRLIEVMLTGNSDYDIVVAFEFLRVHDEVALLDFCTKYSTKRLSGDNGYGADALIGHFLAQKGSPKEWREFFRASEWPLYLRQAFLHQLVMRPDGMAFLENDVFHQTQFDDDVIDALALRGDGFEWNSNVSNSKFLYTEWAALRAAKDSRSKVKPLYTLYTTCAESDPRLRRTAVFVISAALGFPRKRTPLPNDETAPTKDELDEAGELRRRVMLLLRGQDLVDALHANEELAGMAWNWLVDAYPQQSVEVARQIGEGSLRFRPQLDAVAGDYFGRHGSPENIRVMLLQPKDRTFSFLKLMLRGIGAEHRHELLPDIKDLWHTSSYLGDDVLLPMYELFDSEEAAQHFKILLDGDTEQQLRAARGYVHIADANVRVEIARLLSAHPDIRVRRTAWIHLPEVLAPAALLKTAEAKPSIEFLLETLSNGDIVARRGAVRALSVIFNLSSSATRDPRGALTEKPVVDGGDPVREQHAEHDELEFARRQAQQWLNKLQADSEKQ